MTDQPGKPSPNPTVLPVPVQAADAYLGRGGTYTVIDGVRQRTGGTKTQQEFKQANKAKEQTA